MSSKFSSMSVRSLLALLAAIVAVACVYFLLVALVGKGRPGNESAAPLTIEQKAAVLNALSQSSPPSSPTQTSAQAKTQLKAIQGVTKSSSALPVDQQQSDVAKLNILRSLNSQ